jgi:hypothetical protein
MAVNERVECPGPVLNGGNWWCEAKNQIIPTGEGQEPNCPSNCPALNPPTEVEVEEQP